MDIVEDNVLQEVLRDIQGIKHPIIRQVRIKPLEVRVSLTVMIPLSLVGAANVSIKRFAEDCVDIFVDELDIDALNDWQYLITGNDTEILIDIEYLI